MRQISFIAIIAGGCLLAGHAMATSISGTPVITATVGKAYSFTPTLSNPSTCSDCFRVRSLPTWARFSRQTGTLSGTPTAAGIYSNIRISARLHRQRYALPEFSISVSAAATSSPISISGTPSPAATVGQFYSFTPTVKAASNATIAFAMANKPVWGAFNAGNGTLSGTPAAADAKTFSNIVISVSDGKTSATLVPFSITVNPAVTGTATLSWSAPTQNTDGTALTNLAGYYIYYGSGATSLTQKLSVAAPATSAAIENLTAGTWYFALSDYTSAGAESARTSTVSKAVN
ncbi:MAG: hypothetical protein JSS24_17025 [Proteobacteria bacterium]|nr:hypothetical protein [Pseudomonadota bacterium]